MIGWCQMNYPTHLVDKRHKREPSPKDEPADLSFIHQKRPISSNKSNQIYKPISNISKDKSITRQEGVGSPPKGFKASVYTLSTTPMEDRTFLQHEMTKQDYSRVKPLAAEIAHRDFATKFEKKIGQVGEIKYHEEPDEELMRHYKRLPNSILTEQSLKDMLSENLTYLNLANLKWVKNEHLNKLGFVAPNLVELNISGTVADDATLEELGKTAVNLKSIDISHCSALTEKGVKGFFRECSTLYKFWAANCPNSVTDESMLLFVDQEELRSLNIDFCVKVTDASLEPLVEASPPLKELHISGCVKITGKCVTALIQKGNYQLEVAELSNLSQPEFDNETMKAVGTCAKLRKLNISGDSNVGDEGLHNLILGLKEADDTLIKKEEGLKHLTEFRMSSSKINSEGAMIKFCNACPNLETLDMNGFVPLGETGINMICKSLPKLRICLINFTDKISDPYLLELYQAYPDVKFVRTIVSHSDPKDNALRVPFPKIPSKKKGKKKKKKK